MPPLTLLIKPASGNCNLQCKYCFYADETEKRTQKSFGMMEDDTLLQLVKRALEEAEGSVTFAFQGGEPTLIGLAFYKKLMQYISDYNRKNLNVHKAIQTNGILIDDEWAEFLAQNDFLVGLSLDGVRSVHDINRVDKLENGTYHQVMKTARLFDKYKVAYNILCVVTSRAARHVDQIYQFYKKNHFQFLQFIPCLDPLGEVRGTFAYSLSPKEYAAFLKTLFDRWYEDFIHHTYISIRQFDNYIQMLMGNPPESCGMSGRCSCSFVIEADGSVYPCDFYVLDEWKIGMVFDHSFEEMRQTSIAQKFISDSAYVSAKCKTCRWYPICRGGCRRDREPFADGKPALNYFCKSYYEFFDYAMDRMYAIARKIQR